MAEGMEGLSYEDRSKQNKKPSYIKRDINEVYGGREHGLGIYRPNPRIHVWHQLVDTFKR